MIDRGEWLTRKRKFWERLWEDLEIGYLDEDLLPILIEFNLRPHVYSLSSCSGRVVLSDSLKPWSREETNIVFKKHEPVSINEIAFVLKKPVTKRLWLIVSGPIIHVSTDSLSEAYRVLRIAREAGFKHSGVLSINKRKGVIVELQTGVRFSHLLATAREPITPLDKLGRVVEIANEILLDGKEVLKRLYSVLRSNRPGELDEYIVSSLKERNIILS